MPIIKTRQNTTDLVAQYFGAIDSLFVMAQMNGISITEDVVPGNNLISLTPSLSQVRGGSQQVVNYYLKTGLDIASEPLPIDNAFPRANGGIGFMKITNTDLPQSNDFISS